VTIATLLAITPLAGLLVLSPARALKPLERALALGAAAFVLLIRGLPALGVFNFDQSPRYLAPVLPIVALLLARLGDEWMAGRDSERWGALALLVLIAIGYDTHHNSGAPLLMMACALWAFLWLLARAGQPAVAIIAALALATAAAPSLIPATRLDFNARAHIFAPLERWLVHHNARVHHATIVTNLPLLATWGARRGLLDPARVHFMLGPDTHHELTRLTNNSNGQRAAIFTLLERHFYGRPIIANTLRPDALAPATLLILTRDARTDHIMPASLWDDRLRVLMAVEDLKIATIRAHDEAP
jgi:hypothetical protein